MRTQLALLVILAACGSKGGASSGDCADGVGHARAISESKMPAGADPKMLDRMKEMMAAASKAMIETCTNDKWSAEVIACLKTATTDDDLVKCQKMLTPEQQTAVQKAVSAATSSIKAPGQIEGGDALAKANELKDKMCACADAACAKGVEKESIRNIRASEHARHDEATKAQFDKIDADMMACFRKLTAK